MRIIQIKVMSTLQEVQAGESCASYERSWAARHAARGVVAPGIPPKLVASVGRRSQSSRYSSARRSEPEPSFLAARFSLRRSLSVLCGFFFSCFFGLSALLLMGAAKQ